MIFGMTGVDMIELACSAAPAPARSATKLWLMQAGSPKTLGNYVRDLGLVPWSTAAKTRPVTWLGWAGDRDLDPLTATAVDGITWAQQLAAAELSPGSKARLLTTAKAWYHTLAWEKVAHDDPLRHVKRRRVAGGARPPLRPLSRNEWGWMYDEARRDHRKGVPAGRSLAVMELLSGVGVRSGEVGRMLIKDLLLIGDDWWSTVRGKGDKIRELRVAPETGHALTAYWAARGAANDNEPAIVSRAGSALSDRSVQQLVTDWAARAKIGRRVWPHLIRHTLATQLHDNGVPVRKTQILLGHADQRTTQAIYDHAEDGPSPQDLQAAVPRAARPALGR
jgi:site-specific recombinase XerD